MRDELELSRISIWQYYLFEKNKYELEKAKGALEPEAPRLVATEDSAAYETSLASLLDHLDQKYAYLQSDYNEFIEE